MRLHMEERQRLSERDACQQKEYKNRDVGTQMNTAGDTKASSAKKDLEHARHTANEARRKEAAPWKCEETLRKQFANARQMRQAAHKIAQEAPQTGERHKHPRGGAECTRDGARTPRGRNTTASLALGEASRAV